MNDQFEGFIRYSGPGVEKGEIEIEKAGKALLAFGHLYKNYSQYHLRIDKQERPVLKFVDIRPGSVELSLLLEAAKGIANGSLLDEAALAFTVLKGTGIDAFGKSFFSALGNHVALTIFSKGKTINDTKTTTQGNKLVTEIKNEEGKIMIIPTDDFASYKFTKGNLAGLIQLEKGNVESLSIGYKENGAMKIVAQVKAEDKDYFISEEGVDFEGRIGEPFDESKAEDVEIIGVFVDYYGLAHRYHFSFQARKNQEDAGKQKILCIVDATKVSEIIDLLKPEMRANVKIYGKATRDNEGRFDKIKIEYFSTDLNFNPFQKGIDI